MVSKFKNLIKEFYIVYTIKRSGLFDKKYYLKKNLDVARSCMNPIRHYIRHGWKEGRNPSSDFNTISYIEANKDLKLAECNPLLHYIRHRQEEKHEAYFVCEEPLQEEILSAHKITSEKGKKFSVIMPTWNRKNVICHAIESVLNQSYQNFELIISDDGSNDGTKKIIQKKYAKKLKSGQIRYLYNEHRGVSAARNAALLEAKGEWIAYLDSDNRWRKHFLLMMASTFIKNPSHKTFYCQMLVNDNIRNSYFIRKTSFNLENLKKGNYIDLNVYTHYKDVYDECGGFDETLTRLVDWDIILRHVHKYPPYFLKYVLADYFLQTELNNISYTVPLEENYSKIKDKFLDTVEKVAFIKNNFRLGYILADFPNKSQTFVLAELRQFIKMGYDIKVYYSIEPQDKAEIDFRVDAYKVSDSVELAKLLKEHDRQFCHCHFVYPSVTNFMYPASRLTGIPYSIMPHAVDIFHKKNQNRNNLAQITQYEGCKGIIVHGSFHEQFLIERNVPQQKIIYNSQAFEINNIYPPAEHFYYEQENRPLEIITITRFEPKKGLKYLIEAVADFSPHEIQLNIYGYGREEDNLKILIQKQQISNVHLHGPIKTIQDREEVLRKAHLFALTCIEDENEDRDGVPTVFFEAYAAGIPVLTTDISSISSYIVDGINGILVEQKSVTAIRDILGKIIRRPRCWLAQLADNAQAYLLPRIGTHTTITAIRSLIVPVLDIITVITSKVDFHKVKSLYEQIRNYTMTPYHLYIVLNGCDCDEQKIRQLINNDKNVTFLSETKMVGCGVASNHAIAEGKGEYVIYLCSNEAYISMRGWERNLLNYMANNPNAAMGGTLVCSPKWITGNDYIKQSWFHNFRNKDFARQNPNRCFRHVQGGAFILRRTFFDKHGGFKLAHNYMDIEYSYYAESLGYDLLEIPSIISLTKATRPLAQTYFNENIALMHPLQSIFERELLKKLTLDKSFYCNISASIEFTNQKNSFDGMVHKSGSSPFSRAIYHFLGLSSYTYQGLKLLAICPDMLLREIISKNKMFDIQYYKCSNKSISKIDLFKILKQHTEAECLIINNLQPDVFDRDTFSLLLSKMLVHCKSVVFSVGCDKEGKTISPETIMLSAKRNGFECKKINLSSKVLRLGFLSIYHWTRFDPISPKTKCNICGSSEFKTGPGGRLSMTNMLPECMGCHSLERHRAIRMHWQSGVFKSLNDKVALQFSNDPSICPEWFKHYEISIYKQKNSLDLQNINKPDETYDFIICNHVLEHVPNDKKAIMELFRVVKQGGLVYLTFPAPLLFESTQDWGYPDKNKHGHYRIYGFQDVKKLLDDIIGTTNYSTELACDPVTGDSELVFCIRKS